MHLINREYFPSPDILERRKTPCSGTRARCIEAEETNFNRDTTTLPVDIFSKSCRGVRARSCRTINNKERQNQSRDLLVDLKPDEIAANINN